jgi:hypothetical protein
MSKLILELKSSDFILSVLTAMLKSHSKLIPRIMTISWKLEEQEITKSLRMHLRLKNTSKGSKEIKNRKIQ